MHEFSTAVGIVETITNVAKENKATRIKKVELVVGEFSMLNTEQLKFAFEIAAEGTLAEKADLIIEAQKGEIDCKDCGFKGPVETQKKEVDHFIVDLVNIFECPKCKSNNTKISGGRDIYVKNIEVELGTK
ncbi:MAG: hydrogenase maturation nickel metallochaperone HypA [Candidatus Heimdallarchaeota archaeon]|nr:MAG: hydrogenase maturation nickel metallochaperone HypA [Candidatus Heimdallarchaeota archaeon]